MTRQPLRAKWFALIWPHLIAGPFLILMFTPIATTLILLVPGQLPDASLVDLAIWLFSLTISLLCSALGVTATIWAIVTRRTQRRNGHLLELDRAGQRLIDLRPGVQDIDLLSVQRVLWCRHMSGDRIVVARLEDGQRDPFWLHAMESIAYALRFWRRKGRRRVMRALPALETPEVLDEVLEIDDMPPLVRARLQAKRRRA